MQKMDEKKRFRNLSRENKPAPGGMRVVPKPNHFKRILRKKTHEESRNMKTHQKSDPKMEPKSIKNHSKIDAKKGTIKRGL